MGDEWRQMPGGKRLRTFWHHVLLKKYAPSCALFNQNFELIYIAGNAGKYLTLPDMEINNDLLHMVSKQVVIVLRDAVERFKEQNDPLMYQDIAVSENDTDKMTIYIEKLPSVDHNALFLMEWREELDIKSNEKVTLIETPEVQPDTYAVIRGLQEELFYARQEVQNAIEELETSNEELQASNEELLASNEELQSTNEELQSVNEELYTVNSELQARNRELLGANTTIDNLLISTELGTLFLDRDLNIQFFTPAFEILLSPQRKRYRSPYQTI